MKINMEQIVTNFEHNYQQYINSDNMVNEITQPFWQSLYLTRRRLKNKGVTVKLKVIPNNNVAPDIVNKRTKHSTSISIKKPVYLEKEYFLQSRRLKKQKEYKLGECILVSTKNNSKNFVCPKCGANGTMESFIDGCDYCGAKFSVQDTDIKVASYQFYRDLKREAKHNTRVGLSLFITSIFLVITSLIVKLLASVVNADTFAMAILYHASIILFKIVIPCSFIAALFVGLYKFSASKRTLYYGKSIEFNEETFTTGLEYRLKQIHFAENEEEINIFSQVDLRSLLSIYQDVIDCNILNCSASNYRVKDNMEYMKAFVNLQLFLMFGKKIVERREKINLELCRTYDSTKESNLISLYTCDNCGNTVNLLNGGVCEYCHTRLGLIEHDWVITQYETVNKTFPTKKDILKPKNWLAIITTIITIIVLFNNIGRIKFIGYLCKGAVNPSYKEAFITGHNIIPSLSVVDFSIKHERTKISHHSDQENMDIRIKESEYFYPVDESYTDVAIKYCDYLIREEGFTFEEDNGEQILVSRKIIYGKGKLYISVKYQNGFSLKIREEVDKG